MSMSDEDITIQEWSPYFPSVGEKVKVIGCWSEVMMHMRLADKPIEVALVPDGPEHFAVQVYVSGERFSFPILPSEAGFYYDSTTHCWYCYPDTRS